MVVLSDHNLISRAIELALDHGLELEVLSAGPDPFQGTGPQSGAPLCDLIVIAVGSPAEEPVVALVRSSLVDRIGEIPLLIISDRPFDAMPDAKVYHLRYPFDPIQLRERVCGILASGGAGHTLLSRTGLHREL